MQRDREKLDITKIERAQRKAFRDVDANADDRTGEREWGNEKEKERKGKWLERERRIVGDLKREKKKSERA